MKRIQKNVVCSILIMLLVLFAGPTRFLLETFIDSIGAYISGLITMSFHLFPFEGEQLRDAQQAFRLLGQVLCVGRQLLGGRQVLLGDLGDALHRLDHQVAALQTGAYLQPANVAASVPEPSSVFLMFMGGTALVALRFRCRTRLSTPADG